MTETLPLFPLSTVLLPGASLPLHIFEPRYRQLTVDLVTGAAPGRCFGVVAIKQGWEVGADDIEGTVQCVHEIGCSAVLRDVRRLPDGRFDIIASGQRRFRLLDIDNTSAPYLVGEIEWVPDNEVPAELTDSLPVLVSTARQAHRRYCASAWQREDWHEPDPNANLASLAHLLAADCLLPLDDRQRLLEERCPACRLRMVRRLLNREGGFLHELRAVPMPLSEFAIDFTRN